MSKKEIVHLRKEWPHGSVKSMCGRYLITTGVLTPILAEVTCLKCKGTAEFRDLIDKSSNLIPANFLWPYDGNSIEEAGYEFVNAKTEPYRSLWWKILNERISTATLLEAMKAKP